MAKGSGGAGRGRGGNNGRGGKGTGGNKRKQDRDDDGWTRSVWDVRKPGEKAKPARAARAKPAPRQKRNEQGGLAVATDMGYGRTLTNEMRYLQNQLRDLAKQRGYRDDDPIPGTNGLTPRNLRRNAISRAASEGQLRAAISQLLRNPYDRGRRPAKPAKPAKSPKTPRPSRPSRPATRPPARPSVTPEPMPIFGPIEIPRF